MTFQRGKTMQVSRVRSAVEGNVNYGKEGGFVEEILEGVRHMLTQQMDGLSIKITQKESSGLHLHVRVGGVEMDVERHEAARVDIEQAFPKIDAENNPDQATMDLEGGTEEDDGSHE